MADKVSLSLTPNQALVLFEYLIRNSNATAYTFEDQAEQRVLWDIEATLETQLSEPLKNNYDELVKKARDAVRDSAY